MMQNSRSTFIQVVVILLYLIDGVAPYYTTVTAPAPAAPTVTVTPPTPGLVTVTAGAPPPVTVTAPAPGAATSTVTPPAITVTVQVALNTLTSTQAQTTVTQSASAFVQSFPPPSQVSSSQVTNTTVGANDPRISFEGPWTSSNACGEPSKKTTQQGSSMSFQFIGTGIYMASVKGQDAGTFIAAIDGASTIVDSFAQTSDDCNVTWSSWGLDNILHTIEITFEGTSSRAGGSTSGSFEFAHFVTSSNGTSNAGSGGSGGSGGGSNAAKGIHVPLTSLFVVVFSILSMHRAL